MVYLFDQITFYLKLLWILVKMNLIKSWNCSSFTVDDTVYNKISHNWKSDWILKRQETLMRMVRKDEKDWWQWLEETEKINGNGYKRLIGMVRRGGKDWWK